MRWFLQRGLSPVQLLLPCPHQEPSEQQGPQNVNPTGNFMPPSLLLMYEGARGCAARIHLSTEMLGDARGGPAVSSWSCGEQKMLVRGPRCGIHLGRGGRDNLGKAAGTAALRRALPDQPEL